MRWQFVSSIRRLLGTLLLCVSHITCSVPSPEPAALVFQSDFGVKDAAVASMKGVAHAVSPQLKMYDLTHEIPPYNIWEAAQRLDQAVEYWPTGTVFVSVVDPGVGTDRKSVVLMTQSGHYFVSPDNGTLTLVAERLGIAGVREIDEALNRRRDSEKSYTFHGRDVYAYTGARLAAGVIDFEQVGPELQPTVVSIPYQKPMFKEGVLSGNVPILDDRYGNVWTNIDRATFEQLGVEFGDEVHVWISNQEQLVTEQVMPYQATFGEVGLSEPLLYINSVNNVAIALNQGDFAQKFNVRSGAEWRIELRRAAKPR
ncbi:S-adenosyl-l-methionine hydroxide adenosyltransferase family protein [bacterium]|nr:S-adenosyl-l-methionine hydroxide adenosyltransferase family protein [bacterium]